MIAQRGAGIEASPYPQNPKKVEFTPRPREVQYNALR